jgi:hypothetical protein
MADRSNVYYQQLEQFNQKAAPQPTDDNVQIQKVSAPTDSVKLDDGNAVTATVMSRPFTYGAAQYAQAQYGG